MTTLVPYDPRANGERRDWVALMSPAIELARAVFADAIGGLSATEELADQLELGLDDAGQIAPAEKPATTNRRRRRQTSTARGAAPTSAPAPTPAEPPLPPLPVELEQEQPERSAGTTGTAPSGHTEAEERLEQEAAATEPEPITPGKKRALNRLIGVLREPGHITTEQLYARVAEARLGRELKGTARAEFVDALANDIHGRDELGVLHWAPLRDSLTNEEAAALIERLGGLEKRLKAEEKHGRPQPSLGVLAHLKALLHDVGIVDHDARVAYLSDAAGRPVEHESELTPEEADELVARLTNPGTLPLGDDIPF